MTRHLLTLFFLGLFLAPIVISVVLAQPGKPRAIVAICWCTALALHLAAQRAKKLI